LTSFHFHCLTCHICVPQAAVLQTWAPTAAGAEVAGSIASVRGKVQDRLGDAFDAAFHPVSVTMNITDVS